MAPVGSMASLRAAIDAGADAVYFGVQGLNMRSRSSANFSLDDMAAIAAECTAAGVSTYLTVNTVLYDNDIDYMHSVVDGAKRAGISAIIASDIAAILYCRQAGIPVHISTQVNITNAEAVRFYAQWADVMVLARELNLEQVSALHSLIERENICGPSGRKVRIEMFCHGALCMAVSGKCYMSLHEMNSSANRGACTQICRRSYLLTDRETGDEIVVDNQYLMSPKDLKTIHFLDRMVEAGVTVFKIEGRARSAEYVKETVESYDTALRAICDGTYTPELIAACEQRLTRVFNRGFWDGYYLGQRLGEWSTKYGSSATRTKRYVAKPLRYFPSLQVAEFLMEAGEISEGDELILTGPTTGAHIFTAGELRLDTGRVATVRKGDIFSVAVPAKTRPSDRLYRWETT